jgi:tetratricopeptide (TPR) repeat protein
MKLLLTLVLAGLCAFGASRWAGAALGAEQTAAHDDEHRALALRDALARIRTENARLAAELERRAGTLVAAEGPADDGGPSEADIAAALARWRAAHPDEALRAEEPAAPRALPADAEIARVPMTELVELLSGTGFSNVERQEMFERLRKAGRIDEYVAAIEALAAADPENADLQVALGHAYLQKLFGMGNTSETGMIAMKSDAAFDRALEIDDENWAARFSKAVALSNWPAFMGRGPEAIEHFELLLEQQADAPEQRDEYAMTYLFLGNMYQAAGDAERALATWKAGLALFPGVDDLERAIELAGRE